MSYRLAFSTGPRDGAVLLLDEPPAQDEFDGYWIEDVIVNGQLEAVPLHRATPNNVSLWDPQSGGRPGDSP
jgi:hypothetical protein